MNVSLQIISDAMAISHSSKFQMSFQKDLLIIFWGNHKYEVILCMNISTEAEVD